MTRISLRWLHALRTRLLRCQSGNTLILVGLAMPVMFGMLGLAVDGSNWYNTRRAMQNAADAAVVAATTNNSSNYLAEAQAVARQYGFTHNVDNVTVAASNAATCPSGGTTCYSVTITKKVKLVFAQIVGYSGDTTIGTDRAENLSVTAKATQGTTTHEYCLLALGDGTGNSSVIDITANGSPKANLSGCGVASMQSMRCNGSNGLGADYGDAIGTNSGCGAIQNDGVASITDPYAALNTNVPSNTCGTGTAGTTWTTQTIDLSTGTKQICGDLTINGDVTLTGTGIILINNGNLVLGDGKSLTTATGAGVTIIFTGDNSHSHTIIGGNKNTTLDISAPTSGTWKGIVIYQARNLTSGVNVTFSGGGQSPTFNLIGVVYLPYSNVNLNGSVSKNTTGSCSVFVVAIVTFDGGGYTSSRASCKAAGVTLATGQLSGRGMLVD